MSKRKHKLALRGGKPVLRDVEYKENWPPGINHEIKKALIRVIHRGETASYDKTGIVAEFEDRFANYHGVKYALSHNSGTSALHAAYFAIDIKEGDEVIVPTYTFHATVTPLLNMHGVPIFCNMDPHTLNIDPEEVAQSITPRTKAIVITHMWGHPCEMDELVQLAHENDLCLIEDCSHAHGAIYKSRKVGSFGDIACFSLAQGKPISAGHGGMFITNNEDFLERAILLGHFGERAMRYVASEKNRQFVETGFGFNYHMSPLNAAIGDIYLEYLDERNQIARENMSYLTEKLSDTLGISPPVTKPYVSRACYGYKPKYMKHELGGLPIDRYVEALQAEGIRIKRPDSKPLHALPNFSDDNHSRSEGETFFYKANVDLSTSEQIFDILLSLKVFRYPAREIIDQLAEAFRKVADNVGELL